MTPNDFSPTTSSTWKLKFAKLKSYSQRWGGHAKSICRPSAIAFRAHICRKMLWHEGVSRSSLPRTMLQPKTTHLSSMVSALIEVATREAYSSGFTSRITLDQFPFGRFRGSVISFRIPIFRYFENS